MLKNITQIEYVAKLVYEVQNLPDKSLLYSLANVNFLLVNDDIYLFDEESYIHKSKIIEIIYKLATSEIKINGTKLVKLIREKKNICCDDF